MLCEDQGADLPKAHTYTTFVGPLMGHSARAMRARQKGLNYDTRYST